MAIFGTMMTAPCYVSKIEPWSGELRPMRISHPTDKIRALNGGRKRAPVKRAIQIRSLADVRKFWLSVRDVPPRTQSRSNKQYERYYLGLYLLALAGRGFLRYPLKVIEGESPDFMLVGRSGKETGLEITRATDEQFQMAITRAEKEHPNGSAFVASMAGYVGDQLESEWCALVRETIERKVRKFAKFRTASRYDLIVPDDTRMGAGDRRKVMEILAPWARELREREPKIGKISVIASLDVLYDIGKGSLIIPFVKWSSPTSNGAEKGESFSDRVVYAGQFIAKSAIRAHKATGSPLYSIDSKGRLVKETADGRRYEIRISETGEERTAQELSRK
jgi:hypothetical protein